jgi:hypothetical protein
LDADVGFCSPKYPFSTILLELLCPAIFSFEVALTPFMHFCYGLCLALSFERSEACCSCFAGESTTMHKKPLLDTNARKKNKV